MQKKQLRYKIIDDVAIADIAFEIYGKDINELFENAALAIFEQSADIRTITGNKKQVISLNPQPLDTLLIDFLSELVYLKDASQLLGKAAKVSVTQKNKKYSLKAEIVGDTINQKKHILKSDIKAITYHMFRVEQMKNGWKAFVVVDI